MSSVNITYETLFELLRLERNREELQKLEDSFFQDVVAYLNDKQEIINQDGDDMFAQDEKQSTQKQIDNVKRILKELYERREKKIINIAINKSRTGSDLVTTNELLKEEKVLFEMLLKDLSKARKGILHNMLHLKPAHIDHDNIPNPQPVQGQTTTQEKKEEPQNTLIRFTGPVPKFVGTNLEEYGPFDAEDLANVPTPIAKVLISKDKAIQVVDEKKESM